jgi:hypothetical protein
VWYAAAKIEASSFASLMACPVATSAARMNSSQNSDSSDSSRTVPIFEQNSFRDRAWQALR